MRFTVVFLAALSIALIGLAPAHAVSKTLVITPLDHRGPG
jgi:hypothetical protein